MGFLRIYLALCVLSAHSSEIFLWGKHRGHEAVQIFFIISGFYMAMVYGKYKNKSEFYFSRFLRIFIPYWTICMGIIVVSFLLGINYGIWGELEPYVDYSQRNGIAGILITLVTNITIFGQDVVMFLSHDFGESLSFTAHFENSSSPLWKYLIIPPAWSVAIELAFYLCIPVLLKLRTRTLSIIVCVSLLSRVAFYEILGLKGDPWVFRFFPFELALFLFGILSFRISNKRKDFFTSLANRIPRETAFNYIIQSTLLLFVFWLCSRFTRLDIPYIEANYLKLLSYFVWAAILPFLFSITRNSKMDRFIGELSYPIYLVHLFVISAVSIALQYASEIDLSESVGFVSAIISIVLSMCLVWLVIYPLDGVRYQLAKRLASRAKRLNLLGFGNKAHGTNPGPNQHINKI